MKLFLNANRNGYSTDQCGRTLTVRELLQLLEEFDEDAPVYLKHDGGYTYGAIVEADFEEEYDEDGEAE